MAKIQINNPRQIINGGAKKYYFKVKGLGGPKGDKGDKGDTGSRGPQGEPGNAATVYVGSTTTLPVGYDATVENVGTQYNAVLNFGIPQGPRGPQGIQGERGEPGQTGQTGPRGPQGERGTNATVYIGTTTTLNPGSQATVYNSGTENNAVLNFGIPRGDVGPQPELVQTTGSSTKKAMSQNATTVALNGKQNKLTAGSNIQISSNTISATDTTYTAGNGLTLTGTEFSADTTVLATQTDIAPKLETEVVAELPTTGEQDKLYLTPKNYPTGTASGNPITVSLGEDEGAIDSFQLDGDTYQQTYTGKNLFDKNTGIVAGYTYSANGGLAVLQNSSVQETYIPVLPNTAYIMWTEATSSQTTNFRVYICEYDSDKGFIQRNVPTPVISNQNQIITTANTRFVRLCFSTIAADTLQLEAGSTATTYEPYTGGIPAPNPDYPQPIQTVTGEQTVDIVGKNLFDKANANILNNTYLGSTALGTADGAKTLYIPCDSDTTYTISKISSARFVVGTTAITPASGVSFNGRISDYTATQITITTNSTAKYLVVFYYLSTADTIDEQSILNSFQIELGSTATTYAPYSKQTLPIDLGSIELCKIGTYQDYIYKSGDDWKVHKATGSDSASNRTWIWAGVPPNGWYYTKTIYGFYETNVVNVISEKIIGVPRYDAPDISSTFITMSYDGNIGIRNKEITGSANVSQFTDWLDSLNMTWRYALATPTDTTITDQTLIAQLEAIRTAALENGANTITNTATGSNLAGNMEIGYYGYNPRNRYDKWLWLDINNNYEQLGS